jgi:hypothetical protein
LARAYLLPLLSVSVLAYWYRAPFNGFVFTGLTAVLAFSIPRGRDDALVFGPPWAIAAGAAMIAFAWTYPHFLDASRSPFAYLYAAPVGLVPCPTLSLLVGLTLMTGAFAGTRAAVVLAVAGLFYGFVGLVKLKVSIDAVLVAGSFGLLVLAIRGAPSPARMEGGGVP